MTIERTYGTSTDGSGGQQTSLFDAVRDYWWVIAISVIGFIFLGFMIAASQGSNYQATATLIIADPRAANPFVTNDGGPVSNQSSERYLADQVEILRSAEIAEVASGLLDDEYSAQGILRRRSVAGELTSNAIVITFDADDPDAAKRGADSIAEAYIVVRDTDYRDTANGALARVDALIVEADSVLDGINGQINVLVVGDEERQRLMEQMSEGQRELALLRAARDGAPLGSETRAELNAQIDELLRDFQVFALALGVDDSDTELTLLLAERDAAIDELAALTRERNQLVVAAEVGDNGVALFSPAQTPNNETGLSTELILVASTFLGLALGTAIAYGLSLRRSTVTDRKVPESVLAAPMLVDIPSGSSSKLPIVVAPDSAAAEAYRFIASAISGQQSRVIAAGDEPARSLAVLSATDETGRPAVTANAAIAYAQEGRRVLIIDADFDRQLTTEIIDAVPDTKRGLSDIVAGSSPIETTVVKLRSVAGVDLDPATGGSVDYLSGGETATPAASLVRALRSSNMIESLTANYDLVILDCPALLDHAYALSLLDLVDASLAVVSHGEQTGVVDEFGDYLDLAGAPVVGYVYDRSSHRHGITLSGTRNA